MKKKNQNEIINSDKNGTKVCQETHCTLQENQWQMQSTQLRFINNAIRILCNIELCFKGCPGKGFYGSNCSIPCADINCQYCHIEKGTCQDYKPESQCQPCEIGKKGL